MGIELLRDHDLDGVIQNCVKLDCSCGTERVIPFQKMNDRERTSCPQCGSVRSFHVALIDKFENELNGDPSDN